MSQELVHRVCAVIREHENCGFNEEAAKCLECPAVIYTDYGPGMQGCRLMAQEIIDMVRLTDSADPKQSSAGGRVP